MKYNDLPIGVFDSGVGGLTACKTIEKVLPNENIVYFGDTANAPYGVRSNEEITKLSIKDVEFLLSKNVKAILIACGTITSVCIEELRKMTDVPIIGVVNASSIKALNTSKSKRICALATPATTAKHAYSKYMKNLNPSVETFDLGCPLFVPLIESSKITEKDQEMVDAINGYMAEVKKFNPDTIILGCTHFPLIEPLMKKLYPEYTYVLAGDDAVYELKELLEKENLANDPNYVGHIDYYASGDLDKFNSVAKSFLNIDIKDHLYHPDHQ